MLASPPVGLTKTVAWGTLVLFGDVIRSSISFLDLFALSSSAFFACAASLFLGLRRPPAVEFGLFGGMMWFMS